MKLGAASSAYQIEGAVGEDGRGESIWDRFCRTPGAVADGATGDVACDHYHRWREDVELMAGLGLHAYRFSIAWPRVQPDGRGAFNRRGIEFYRRLAGALRERDIDPVVTLYHGDLPAALQDSGGWVARDTAERFAAYAERMAAELGDLVAGWITHNEPWGVAFAGHLQGVKAPGLRDWPTALQVAHHLLVSHGLALQAVRTRCPAVPVGIALNLAAARPASGSAADRDAARRQDGFVNRWFLDPLFRGAYPEDLGLAPFAVRDGDLETIAAPLGFLGINVYHPDYVRHAPGAGPLELAHAPAPPPHSPLGWQVDPGNLRDLLARLVSNYGRFPIWVTENGVSDDPAAPDPLADEHRIAALAGHLDVLREGIADVERYFVWSLLDSFEWELGYRAPFGLVHVDFASGRRTPKRSALWYRDVIGRAAAG